MRISFLLIGTLFLSCNSSKNIQKVSFRYYENTQKKKITLYVPSGGRLMKISAGGEGEEYRYCYSDSAILYVSSQNGSASLNMPFIRRNGYYDRWFLSDTASFEGTDDRGRLWKEVKRADLVYGYTNVSIVNKLIFDKALQSVK